MSIAPRNMVQKHLWIRLDGRDRHLLCYTDHQDAVDDSLDAQMAAALNKMWCFHGTSLTAAHKVFEEGGLLAQSKHKGSTGVFVIGKQKQADYSLAFNWRSARDRAQCYLCTEWTSHGAPSAWSMPVVIMFPHMMAEIKYLKDLSVYPSAKYVINRDVGDYVQLPKDGLRLLVDYDEYWAWRLVHDVHQCSVPLRILRDHTSEDLLMCGGRIDDPFYWSTARKPEASCGRMCRVRDLERSYWTHAKNAPVENRIYRCPLCKK